MPPERGYFLFGDRYESGTYADFSPGRQKQPHDTRKTGFWRLFGDFFPGSMGFDGGYDGAMRVARRNTTD